MRPPITINDPAWYNTFPHLVEPGEDEWLAGLLLRCDEANNWESGGTLACLLDASPYSRLTTGYKSIKGEHLEKLASRLALPLASITATTYQAELARLYEGVDQHPRLSRSRSHFHICPLCVSEDQMLSRWLTLPGNTHCPQHRVLLVGQCQCGKPLLPFDRYAPPFTCGNCGLGWATLPVVQAGRGHVETEGKLLSYYHFFFSSASPSVFASVLRLIAERQETQGRRRRSRSDAGDPSLEHLVGRLIELAISTDDLQFLLRPDGASHSESKKGGDHPSG